MTDSGDFEKIMNLFAPGRDLIVYVEVDRCATDAIQAITGCSLGRRSLKHKDFGKFAATFVDSGTGNAIRVAIDEKNREINEKLPLPEIVRVLL
jgi:formylmethanofuran dehydrogenase subunit E